MATTTLFNKTALANGTSNLIVRSDALNQSTDLVQAGVVFNDAVRDSTGLFSLSGSGNQNPFLGSYTTDIHAVQNDITAMLATPGNVTLGGVTFAVNSTDTAVLTNIEAQLGTLLTAAPQTTNPATLSAADQTLHSVQSEILQEVSTDPHIAAALNNVTFLSNTGANDIAFQNTPAGADDPAALAAATSGSSLKAVGEVFNAATALSAGGIHAGNLGEITTDFTAVQQGLTNIVNNATMLAQIETGETANAAALTTIHLQTALNQINLQLTKYDGAEAAGSNLGLRGTADNLLDIIDIIQNDPNLNTAAGGNGAPAHTGGFAEMPGALTGTVTHFQDNQAQTNFWAAFLSEANTINAHLTAIAGGQEQASATLVTQIQNYQQFGANFDAAQGQIFQARFDNELNNGTLEADTSAAVKGLTGILNGDTGAALAADHAMITAAGQGFSADAQDVSGNNMAIGGASYVGDAVTVATATSVNGLAQGNIPVTATPNIANGTGGTATSATTTSGTTSTGAGTSTPTGGTSSAGGTSSTGGTSHTGGTSSGGETSSTGGASSSGGTSSAGGSSSTGATSSTGGTHSTGPTQSTGTTPAAGDHSHDSIASDISALMKALQGGDTNAVSTAVTALGDAVHSAAFGATAGTDQFAQHQHLEHMHMWG